MSESKEDRIVIVGKNDSPKLTTRGKGLFSYEKGKEILSDIFAFLSLVEIYL